jgi:DNA-directed RNA polymerase specialized sigma24 family protein
MHSRDEISTLELARMCREESERYRRSQLDDCGHCFELFRRAIVSRDQQAWAAICEQYRRLVARWVNGPPDRVDERINVTFARFWQAVNPKTFIKFSSTGKVMAFLRACARSVRIDEHRRQEKHKLLVGLEDAPLEVEDTTALQATDNILRRELFAYIEQRLRDEQERLLFDLSFRVGLMPRQIVQEYPDHFTNVAQVRRIKERVLLRLSTDLRLQEWWKK